MKFNYLILFGVFFSIFIIPSEVFAEEQDLYVPYYNKISNFTFDYGEELKNTLYNHPDFEKRDGDKCVLLYQESLGYSYHLICSPTLSNIVFYYTSSTGQFWANFNGYYYRFTDNFSISSKQTVFSFFTSYNSFENVVLYSDVGFSFDVNGVSNIFFYDINDSSKIYGQFKTKQIYYYTDFYLLEPDNVVVFEDNNLHTISKLILGDIPENYSIIYTISDYLLCLLLVVIIISPLAIIIKIMRW